MSDTHPVTEMDLVGHLLSSTPDLTWEAGCAIFRKLFHHIDDLLKQGKDVLLPIHNQRGDLQILQEGVLVVSPAQFSKNAQGNSGGLIPPPAASKRSRSSRGRSMPTTPIPPPMTQPGPEFGARQGASAYTHIPPVAPTIARLPLSGTRKRGKFSGTTLIPPISPRVGSIQPEVWRSLVNTELESKPTWELPRDRSYIGLSPADQRFLMRTLLENAPAPQTWGSEAVGLASLRRHPKIQQIVQPSLSESAPYRLTPSSSRMSYRGRV